MKRFFALFAALAVVFTLAACGTEEGDYTPGVYFGYTDGNQNTFAVVTVDENGFIVSILVDSVYLKVVEDGGVEWTDRRGNEVEGIATTKRSLDGGCDYVMHEGTVDCEAPDGQLMWHLQVDEIAARVIEEQGMFDYTLDGQYFEEDVLAGVTIRVTAYISAIEAALEQAAK